MSKTFIFDMDGVLIESEEFYFERRMRFFREHDLTPGTSDINDYLGASNEQVWKNLVPDESKRSEIKKVYDVFLESNIIDYPKCLKNDVNKVLFALKNKGYKVILASAGERNEIERMLTECSLNQYFDLVLSGEEVEHNKPAPDIYLQAVKQSQSLKSDCIVIEDSTTGITAAKTAGLETWAVKTATDQSQADLILNDLSEIIEKL
jgi:HAD superfamily hydrolase (TIGR01509 family)